MTEAMEFPKTLDEFMEQYKIVDTEQVYTNGTELVPIFRIKQWEDAHQPRKGKWEMVWNTFFHTELPKCTVCKNFEVYKTNFCPNCGADMRKEKDDG